MIKALQECKGMVYVAAAKLGCAPKTIKKRMATVPGFKEEVEASEGMLLDFTEMKLFESIKAGDPWAIQFYLKTKGRNRGYSDRTDVTVNGAVDLVIPFLQRRGNLELVDAGEVITLPEVGSRKELGS